MAKKSDYSVIDNLLQIGANEGSLTTMQIEEAFSKVDSISPERVDEFYEKCSINNIEIIDNQDDVKFDMEELEEIKSSKETQERGSYYTDSVSTYLMEIGKIPLLSAEEEIQLAKTIKEGTTKEEAKRAKERLVEANLRLVVSMAKNYARIYDEPLLDIIQNGNMGLIKAIDKFNYKMGFKLSTYASYWIKQSITRAHADTSRQIRLPAAYQENITKIKETAIEIAKEKGKEPTAEEIAEYLKIPVKKVRILLVNSQDIVSLETPISDEEGASLMDFVADKERDFAEKIVDKLEVETMLKKASRLLTKNEMEVIIRRFGLLGHRQSTLDEVADQMGFTRERARQLEGKGLSKLWKYCRKKRIKE